MTKMSLSKEWFITVSLHALSESTVYKVVFKVELTKLSLSKEVVIMVNKYMSASSNLVYCADIALATASEKGYTSLSQISQAVWFFLAPHEGRSDHGFLSPTSFRSTLGGVIALRCPPWQELTKAGRWME